MYYFSCGKHSPWLYLVVIYIQGLGSRHRACPMINLKPILQDKDFSFYKPACAQYCKLAGMPGFVLILDSVAKYNCEKSYREKAWVLGQCTHIKYVDAVNHVFEIQYCRARPPNNQSSHLSKISKAFGCSDEKPSAVDPGGHGAAVLESNFPKFQSTWGLLSLL